MMQEKYVDSTFAKIYYKESFRLLVFTAEDKPPHPPRHPKTLYIKHKHRFIDAVVELTVVQSCALQN